MSFLISFFQRYTTLCLSMLVVLTRLPFIFDGYGVEEDSWGLVVNAHEMHDWGHYVASRFPGHPLQEYAYLLIWNQPAWIYNLWSLLFSVIAVVCFYQSLVRIKFNHALAASLMFCFTPVFYISGTYTIDFAWTLAFVCASFYALVTDRLWLSGILLGLAVGCRLTTGVFVLPWAMLLYNSMDKRSSFFQMLKIALPATVIGVLWFVPAFLVYGKSFFDYSDQFPYPPWSKIAYKASIGVFGLLGLVALLLAAIQGLRNWRKREIQAVSHFSTERLLAACAVIVVLHVISYLRLPQKSGYLVPLIPFVIMAMGLLLNRRWFMICTGLFVASPFLMSVNLTDDLRGSSASAAAIRFHVSGQEIFIDPFSGPIFSERSKRLRKMEYCERVLRVTDTLRQPNAIVAGWWYNELKTEMYARKENAQVKLLFYVPFSTLDSLSNQGSTLYYLPEQDLYNDQMFQQNGTAAKAMPFPQK
ncbi:MAG: ArnT family glycosyltransferase [Bacteroidia bacterium]